MDRKRKRPRNPSGRERRKERKVMRQHWEIPLLKGRHQLSLMEQPILIQLLLILLLPPLPKTVEKVWLKEKVIPLHWILASMRLEKARKEREKGLQKHPKSPN